MLGSIVKGIAAPNWLVLQVRWVRETARVSTVTTRSPGRVTGRNTELDDIIVALYFALIFLSLGLVVLLLVVVNGDSLAVRFTSGILLGLPIGHFAGWWIGEVASGGAAIDAATSGSDPWRTLVVHSIVGWILAFVVVGLVASGAI